MTAAADPVPTIAASAPPRRVPRLWPRVFSHRLAAIVGSCAPAALLTSYRQDGRIGFDPRVANATPLYASVARAIAFAAYFHGHRLPPAATAQPPQTGAWRFFGAWICTVPSAFVWRKRKIRSWHPCLIGTSFALLLLLDRITSVMHPLPTLRSADWTMIEFDPIAFPLSPCLHYSGLRLQCSQSPVPASQRFESAVVAASTPAGAA